MDQVASDSAYIDDELAQGRREARKWPEEISRELLQVSLRKQWLALPVETLARGKLQ